MAEDFDGNVTVSPSGTTTPTITLEGNGGNARLGGNGQDGDVVLSDGSGTERVHLNADGQRIELHNNAGEIIGMMGGGGNIRAGSNGENGNLFLYRDEAGNIFSTSEWSVRLVADDGRLEIKNSDGELVCMLGADGNLRLGSGDDGGDVYLYRSSADSLFNNAEATVRLSGNSGDMTLGGSGVHGDVNLRDSNGRTRVRINPGNERMEVLNTAGEIVGMFGASGNMRLGSNGDGGDIFLYRSNASSLFTNADATVQLSGNGGDMTLGGSGVNGDVNLRDSNGNVRIRMNPGSQRMEVLNASGDVVGMMGANGNLRLGSNGSDGDVLLYANGSNNIFNDGDATIHMNGDTGDIILRNADCAEEFKIAGDMAAEPGMVMVLDENGDLTPCTSAFDRGAVGVISGAVQYRPGIVLDRQPEATDRAPVALMGKVCVCVTDANGPIRIGDLLTTSDLPGHAMRAGTAEESFGAVVGKALGPHDEGTGMIPMVIALQ
ncbi:MAG: hypothetical protein AAFV19_08790 [Pseudomonadota bacterium]